MELLTWPVSEDLIGRKVKCLKNNSDAWLYEEGDVYVIGADSYGDVGPVDEEGFAPNDKTREELFSFELLPEGDEEVAPITTTIAPSLIPEGYELTRVGLVKEGELYVYGDGVVEADCDGYCPLIIVKKIKHKTKTMYNIHTGEPVEVPYDLTHNTTSASLTQRLGMETLNVSLGFSSKEPFKHFADELFTNDGKDLGV